MDTLTECPNHAGAFDCSPFCNICEGNQETTIRFQRSLITGQHYAECTACDFQTTYWEDAPELQHECNN